MSEFPENLSCPVCMEIPSNEIFQCKNGHILCDSCSARLDTCPHCRVPFYADKIRNRALEDLLSLMKFDCIYKSKGCKSNFTRQTISEHTKICEYSGDFIDFCHLWFGVRYHECRAFSTKKMNDAIQHIYQLHSKNCWILDKQTILIDCGTFLKTLPNRFSPTSPMMKVCSKLQLRKTFGQTEFSTNFTISPLVKNVEIPSSVEPQISALLGPFFTKIDAFRETTFIIHIAYNKQNQAFSPVCIQVNHDAVQNIKPSSDIRVEFVIRSQYPSKAPDLVFNTVPTNIKHASSVLNQPNIQIPMSSIRAYYCIDDAFSLEFSFLKTSLEKW